MAQSDLFDQDEDEVFLANRELVSLFLQYPDMAEIPHDEHSVGSSDSDDDEDSATSDTTTQTTPLRSDPTDNAAGFAQPLAEFPCFFQKLQQSSLPAPSIHYLRTTGLLILRVAQLRFVPNRTLPLSKEHQLDLKNTSNFLVSLLRASCCRVNDQIDNIAYILTLAPFTVRPAPEDLWVTYKQMTELIIQHTHLPSLGERDLLTSLVRAYDAHVYHPANTLFQTIDYGQSVQSALDQIYDALMMLEHRYNRWCKDMKELGDWHTKPIMRRILGSPEIMGEVEEFEAMKRRAESTITDLNGTQGWGRELKGKLSKIRNGRRPVEPLYPQAGDY